MNEDPSYRPKIFYTEGDLAGPEQPFPLEVTTCATAMGAHQIPASTQHQNFQPTQGQISSLSPERKIIAKPIK